MEQIVNGLVLGGIYALIAVGYTMVYGVIQLINFAHGEIFMFGAYFTFLCLAVLKFPLWLAVLASILLCALMGVVIDLIAYRPLRNAPRLSALITAIGISLILQNLARMIWGAEPRRDLANAKSAFLSQTVIIPGGAQLSYLDLSIIILAILLMVGLNRLISLTRIGKAMRACAQDKMAASLMGIDTNRVIGATFAIGSALGAVAGIMVGMRETIEPTMGYYKGVAAFAAAVLGGIGNITGAMLGGVVLGIAEVLGAGYISSGYRVAISYILMILVIVFRPAGLLGRASAKRA
ncbi:MAG: branched-chain amino acid ABC transporter permease [Candidatus Poribacteria bacterium]|nr:branched-chain amino acid ABC transporter permease [Candidatus Poribacteria bacterium]MDP6747362.1 branched-chain amino acid ABC transporter permease [Candidatus Poribacteria bacterium]MDP6995665.1 branched-chain amino acid ABC transporter permease [Candidatus Poribacteria bacterium]